MSGSKVKIEIPNQLPESGLTRVQFKTWKECMIVYLKQSDDFLHFLPGGLYENWIVAGENEKRIAALHNDDKPVARENENQEALEISRLKKGRGICQPCLVSLDERLTSMIMMML